MSETRTTVFLTTQFEGFHYWSGAPDSVAFLRSPHRHVFHVRVDVRVSHDDRDVEFILAKRVVDEYFRAHPVNGRESCEMIARRLMTYLGRQGWNVAKIEVNEDGENGATIERG